MGAGRRDSFIPVPRRQSLIPGPAGGAGGRRQSMGMPVKVDAAGRRDSLIPRYKPGSTDAAGSLADRRISVGGMSLPAGSRKRNQPLTASSPAPAAVRPPPTDADRLFGLSKEDADARSDGTPPRLSASGWILPESPPPPQVRTAGTSLERARAGARTPARAALPACLPPGLRLSRPQLVNSATAKRPAPGGPRAGAADPSRRGAAHSAELEPEFAGRRQHGEPQPRRRGQHRHGGRQPCRRRRRRPLGHL